MNIKALLNTLSNKVYTLPIVILYVTEACNLRCIMCSYRDRLPHELKLEEIEGLAADLYAFGLKRIVFSGGEPLLRKDFPEICKIFRGFGVRETLLSNGVLLEKRLEEVGGFLDEVLVSLDGATGETHNEIRGVNSYDVIVRGIRKTKETFPSVRLGTRTVIQRKNFRQVPDVIDLGLQLGVDRVSFLAVDALSTAFGRDRRPLNGELQVHLDAEEVQELRVTISELAKNRADLFASGFIAESPARLFEIADYFAIAADGQHFPRVRCNAPMVSSVITSSGEVLPCYFLPRVGNIRSENLLGVLNSGEFQKIRKDVRAFRPEACQSCVCRLNVSPQMALKDSF